MSDALSSIEFPVRLSGKPPVTLLLHVLRGHVLDVQGLAFSPDSRRLASASDDGTVKVWDTTSSLELLTLRREGFKPQSVAFSPDGHLLAAGGNGTNGKVLIWDTATPRSTPPPTPPRP